ncbi:hypothetical protein LCGC14_1355760 [marine sediment metagenome]|uniref:Uncharacterized protein n=1 Tax=marine sediment metagenome TaxID=412755 RepID=A0A0F9KVT5_9ZZZZ
MKVLRVTNSDRYEVSDKGRVWKSGPRRHGPIPELRIPVHGFSWGAGYRAFLRVATPRWAASSFGVFIKLQEVGANAELAERWLIVPRSGGVTSDTTVGYFAAIAEETGFSEKDITKAVEVLTHKEVAWLDWVEVEDDSRTVREFPDNPAQSATCTVLLCTESSVSKKEAPPENPAAESTPEPPDDVDAIWTHYKIHRPRVRVLSEKVRGLILKRLKETFTVDDLKLAIDGNFRSPHHCGQNDTQTEYHNLELIVRDTEHVQQFIDLADAADKPVLGAKSQLTARAVESFVRRVRKESEDA